MLVQALGRRRVHDRHAPWLIPIKQPCKNTYNFRPDVLDMRRRARVLMQTSLWPCGRARAHLSGPTARDLVAALVADLHHAHARRDAVALVAVPARAPRPAASAAAQPRALTCSQRRGPRAPRSWQRAAHCAGRARWSPILKPHDRLWSRIFALPLPLGYPSTGGHT